MCRCFAFYRPLYIIQDNPGRFKRKSQRSRAEDTKYGVV